MTDETVDCFNCGRPNPAWAQVCRSCGVPLRHGVARTAPSGPIPTDRESVISIGAVVATIVVAVVIGVMLANLNPVDPAAIAATPSPSPTPEPSIEATSPSPSVPASPIPVPAPVFPGTVVFGTGISNGQITGQTDTFTPGVNYAHVVTMPEPFGVATLGEQVVQIAEDGTQTEVVAAARNQLAVDPAASSQGVVCCDARALIAELGPGTFLLRVYRGEEIIAEGQFILAEG